MTPTLAQSRTTEQNRNTTNIKQHNHKNEQHKTAFARTNDDENDDNERPRYNDDVTDWDALVEQACTDECDRNVSQCGGEAPYRETLTNEMRGKEECWLYTVGVYICAAICLMGHHISMGNPKKPLKQKLKCGR
jgi:hypothetical protein